MNLFSILYQTGRYKLAGVTAISVLAASPFPLKAQSPVTAVFTHKENAAASTIYSGTGATGSPASGYAGNTYTYQFGLSVATTNNTTIIDSLRTLGLNYHYQPANYLVKFRRVDNSTVTGLRKAMRIEQTGGTIPAGGTVSLYPDYNDSLEQVFTHRIFNIGIDNTFQNDGNSNNINIERIDAIFPGGINSIDNTKAGFVVFDWGDAGDHDPFYIAAIKTLDAAGNPASYYDAVSVTKNHYGSDAGGNCTYVILRKNTTDARLLLGHSPATQTRDGVFLRFNDFGISNNTVIYGYSILSPDTKVSPAAQMVDYTNTTNFPTTSDLPGGGLELLAVTGLWVTDEAYITLPDLISELHTSVVNKQVKLNWDMHSINDLKEQVVERSEDGKKYIPILHIPIQAEGLQTALDTRPINGKNFYRLKLIQQDGTMAGYSTVSLVDLKATSSISMDVYPNPVKNKLLNLDIRGLINKPYVILLLDMNGRPVLSQPIVGEEVVQQSLYLPMGIATGTYVLKLTDKTGTRVLERRILVE